MRSRVLSDAAIDYKPGDNALAQPLLNNESTTGSVQIRHLRLMRKLSIYSFHLKQTIMRSLTENKFTAISGVDLNNLRTNSVE